mmetsp:Transcript_57384/g.122018  ORF Transcript_57384/g.122018 Transcript_57384/m.122018 type:complete len:233 (+) Transcript_57384:1437-2135(+)
MHSWDPQLLVLIAGGACPSNVFKRKGWSFSTRCRNSCTHYRCRKPMLTRSCADWRHGSKSRTNNFAKPPRPAMSFSLAFGRGAARRSSTLGRTMKVLTSQRHPKRGLAALRGRLSQAQIWRGSWLGVMGDYNHRRRSECYPDSPQESRKSRSTALMHEDMLWHRAGRKVDALRKKLNNSYTILISSKRLATTLIDTKSNRHVCVLCYKAPQNCVRTNSSSSSANPIGLLIAA